MTRTSIGNGRWNGRAALALAAALAGGGRPAAAADWPMLGGRPERTMVAAETGLPAEWSGTKNVKWSAELGDVTYGSPVVADGRVFIGTNNDDPADKTKRGVMKCFAEADGKLLWRVAYDKLPDPAEDDSGVGVCSTPAVADGRVYYTNNRAELVCREAATGKAVWTLDFRALGVTPNQASSSSPVVADGRVFVVTGQGTNYRTGIVKNPAAPSFVAVDAKTGKVLWQDASPGAKILTGQWSSPSYGTIGGRAQVLFPGGDGWLYALAPDSGKLLWKFNAKAHEKPAADGEPETMFNLVAAPAIVGDRIYFPIGEPEASAGPGALRCLEPKGDGDLTKTAEVWRLGGEEFHDSISTPAVHDGLLYTADTTGVLVCVDAATGRRLWMHDHLANIWGSPLVADGKVYVQTGEGVVNVFATGREKKLLAKNDRLTDVGHGTPVAANGVLYITGQRKLWAIAAGK